MYIIAALSKYNFQINLSSSFQPVNDNCSSQSERGRYSDYLKKVVVVYQNKQTNKLELCHWIEQPDLQPSYAYGMLPTEFEKFWVGACIPGIQRKPHASNWSIAGQILCDLLLHTRSVSTEISKAALQYVLGQNICNISLCLLVLHPVLSSISHLVISKSERDDISVTVVVPLNYSHK